MKSQKMKENSDFLNSKRASSDIPLDKIKYSEEESKDEKAKVIHPTTNKATKRLSLEELEKIVAAKMGK